MKIIITERQQRLVEMDISLRRRLSPGIKYINNLDPQDVCDYWDYDEVEKYVNEVLSDATLSCLDMNFEIYGEIYNYLTDEYRKYVTHFFYDSLCDDDNQINEGENKPTNPTLWSQSLDWARSKYKVCPSAYCNGAAAKRYKSKGGGWRKNKKKSANESVNEDLKRWFKEKWVDVSKKVDGKHPPCGRKDADGKAYPKCRPSKKVSSETPKVASSYDKDEKKAMTQQKRRAEKKDPKVGTGNKPTMTSYKKK